MYRVHCRQRLKQRRSGFGCDKGQVTPSAVVVEEISACNTGDECPVSNDMRQFHAGVRGTIGFFIPPRLDAHNNVRCGFNQERNHDRSLTRRGLTHNNAFHTPAPPPPKKQITRNHIVRHTARTRQTYIPPSCETATQDDTKNKRTPPNQPEAHKCAAVCPVVRTYLEVLQGEGRRLFRRPSADLVDETLQPRQLAAGDASHGVELQQVGPHVSARHLSRLSVVQEPAPPAARHTTLAALNLCVT